MSRGEIVLKPSRGMIDYRFQRPGLGKEMARSRNDLQRLGSSQSGQRVLIEVNDAEIGAADDQKGWRMHFVECITGEVGAPAPRDHCADTARKFRRRDKSRRRPGAGAEQPKRELCRRRVSIEPTDGIDKPARQERDVKDVGAVKFLCRGQ